MDSSRHFQVEADSATSPGDAGSNKKTWLLMVSSGFACFALGVACVCLVLPTASHSDSLQKPATHVLAYTPMNIPIRANPENARVSNRPSSFLPLVTPSSVRQASLPVLKQSFLSEPLRPNNALQKKRPSQESGDVAHNAAPAKDRATVPTKDNSPGKKGATAYGATFSEYAAGVAEPVFAQFTRPAPASPLKLSIDRAIEKNDRLKPYGGYDPANRPAASQDAAFAPAASAPASGPPKVMVKRRVIISEDIACPVEEDVNACIQSAISPTISDDIACPVSADLKACIQAANSPTISENIACPVEEELKECIQAAKKTALKPYGGFDPNNRPATSQDGAFRMVPRDQGNEATQLMTSNGLKIPSRLPLPSTSESKV